MNYLFFVINFAKFRGLRLFTFTIEFFRGVTYWDYDNFTFALSSYNGLMPFRGLTLDLNLFLGRAIGLSFVGDAFEFLIIFITNLLFRKMQGYWTLLYLSAFCNL